MFTLPKLLGDQYVLTSVLKERPSHFVFAATQKDLRREVRVKSLKRECSSSDEIANFLATAKAQSLCRHYSISSTLELFEADGTWHLAQERWNGEPLDILAANSKRLPPLQCCSLLREVCHTVAFLDTMRLASKPFEPDGVYLRSDGSFRFDNPATSGIRTRAMREQTLHEAASWVLRLIDTNAEFANRTSSLALRMVQMQASSPLTATNFAEELSLLQYQMTFR